MSATTGGVVTRSASRTGTRADGAASVPPAANAPKPGSRSTSTTTTTTQSNPKSRKNKNQGRNGEATIGTVHEDNDRPGVTFALPEPVRSEEEDAPTRTRLHEEAMYPQLPRLEDAIAFPRGFADDIVSPTAQEPTPDDAEQAQRVASLDAIQSAFAEVRDEANVAARKLTRMTSRLKTMQSNFQEELTSIAEGLEEFVATYDRKIEVNLGQVTDLVGAALGATEDPVTWNALLIDSHNAATDRMEERERVLREAVQEERAMADDRHRYLKSAARKGNFAEYPAIDFRHGKSSEARLHAGGLGAGLTDEIEGEDRPPHRPFTRHDGQAAGAGDPNEGPSDDGSSSRHSSHGGGAGGGGPPGQGPPGGGPPGGGPPSEPPSSQQDDESDDEEEVNGYLRQGVRRETPPHIPRSSPRTGRQNTPVYVDPRQSISTAPVLTTGPTSFARRAADASVSQALPTAPGQYTAFAGGAPVTAAFQTFAQNNCIWIEEFIDEMLSRTVSKDAPKTYIKHSPPEAYSGADDSHKAFDTWFRDHVRFLKLSRVSGPDLDEDRILCMGNNLTKEAANWYRDEVELSLRNWTFKSAVCALYTRFVRTSSAEEPAEDFDDLEYETSGGANALYNRMTKFSKQMPVTPDKYTLARQFFKRLPSNIRNAIKLHFHISPLVATAPQLLEAALFIEDLNRPHRNRKKALPVAETTVKSSSSNTDRNDRTPRNTSPRPSSRRVRFSSRERQHRTSSSDRITPRPTTQPVGGQLSRSPGATSSASARPSTTNRSHDRQCFACKQYGHISTDPSCPQYGKNSLRSMEVIPSDEVQSPDAKEQLDSELADESDPAMRGIRVADEGEWEDVYSDDDDVVGSQYDSDSDLDSLYTDAESHESMYAIWVEGEHLMGMSIREFYYGEGPDEHHEPNEPEQAPDDSDSDESDDDSIPELVDDVDIVVNPRVPDTSPRRLPHISRHTFDDMLISMDTPVFINAMRQRFIELEEFTEVLSNRLHRAEQEQYMVTSVLAGGGASLDLNSQILHNRIAEALRSSRELVSVHADVERYNSSIVFAMRSHRRLLREITMLHSLASTNADADTMRTLTDNSYERARDEATSLHYYLTQLRSPDTIVGGSIFADRQRPTREIPLLPEDEETVARIRDEMNDLAEHEEGVQWNDDHIYSMIATHDRGYRTSMSTTAISEDRPKARGRCMTFYITVGDVDALVLVDTGSTVNAVSHNFVTAARLKTFPLRDPITLQLGCSGSRSKVNYGVRTSVLVQGTPHEVYFDVANLDHYDIILGIPFLDEVGAILNFRDYTISIGELVLHALKRGEDTAKSAKPKPRAPLAKKAHASGRSGPSPTKGEDH